MGGWAACGVQGGVEGGAFRVRALGSARANLDAPAPATGRRGRHAGWCGAYTAVPPDICSLPRVLRDRGGGPAEIKPLRVWRQRPSALQEPGEAETRMWATQRAHSIPNGTTRRTGVRAAPGRTRSARSMRRVPRRAQAAEGGGGGGARAAPARSNALHKAQFAGRDSGVRSFPQREERCTRAWSGASGRAMALPGARARLATRAPPPHPASCGLAAAAASIAGGYPHLRLRRRVGLLGARVVRRTTHRFPRRRAAHGAPALLHAGDSAFCHLHARPVSGLAVGRGPWCAGARCDQPSPRGV